MWYWGSQWGFDYIPFLHILHLPLYFCIQKHPFDSFPITHLIICCHNMKYDWVIRVCVVTDCFDGDW